MSARVITAHAIIDGVRGLSSEGRATKEKLFVSKESASSRISLVCEKRLPLLTNS